METKMATVDQAKDLIERLRISSWDAAVRGKPAEHIICTFIFILGHSSSSTNH